MGTIFHQLDDNDVLVRLSPFLDPKGEWTGELLVGMISSEDNNLSDDDYVSIMQLGSMLCAAVPLMEDNEKFREMLYNHTQSMLQEDKKKKPKVTRQEDNVIKVNF
jgi:hypothetical protein